MNVRDHGDLGEDEHPMALVAQDTEKNILRLLENHNLSVKLSES